MNFLLNFVFHYMNQIYLLSYFKLFNYKYFIFKNIYLLLLYNHDLR